MSAVMLPSDIKMCMEAVRNDEAEFSLNVLPFSRVATGSDVQNAVLPAGRLTDQAA